MLPHLILVQRNGSVYQDTRVRLLVLALSQISQKHHVCVCVCMFIACEVSTCQDRAASSKVSYSQRCPLGLRCPYAHGAKAPYVLHMDETRQMPKMCFAWQEQLYHPKYFRTALSRQATGINF